MKKLNIIKGATLALLFATGTSYAASETTTFSVGATIADSCSVTASDLHSAASIR